MLKIVHGKGEPGDEASGYKRKKHSSEMKGDVGMSRHEKKGNKKMPILRQEIIDNPIPTSLFMCYAAVLFCLWVMWMKILDK